MKKNAINMLELHEADKTGRWKVFYYDEYRAVFSRGKVKVKVTSVG